MKRILAAVMIIGVMSGCSVINRGSSGSSPAYQVTANREIYSRGNTGEATIKNVSSRQLDYNLCQRQLQRQVNKYWIVAFEWPTAGGACTTEMRHLAKGESVSALFDIPTGVPIGTYRLIFNNLRGKDGKPVSPDDASTRSFEVR
jgi:hypothetical protein